MTTITQSCVETQFIETTTVKLKVASQKTLNSTPPTSTTSTTTSSNPEDLGGWSFLQSLSNVSSSNPRDIKMEKQNVYVHPLTKNYSPPPSSSRLLSEKSLELCTENLGCETGSDTMDCRILSLSFSPSKDENLSARKEIKNLPHPQVEYSSHSSSSSYKMYNKVNNNNNCSRKFPPPLTSMSNGRSSLQFRPHREEGRLVITAVEAPLKHAYFKAERSQGRLRLTFLEDQGHATKFDSQVSDIIEEEEKHDEVDDSDEDYEESAEQDRDFSSEDHHHQLDEEYDGNDDDHDGESGAYMSSDVNNGNIFEIEVEMGMEKCRRLINSRCNEGGHHRTKDLCWGPFLVATS